MNQSFNFENQLEFSNMKRDKTVDNLFEKEFYDLDNFGNVSGSSHVLTYTNTNEFKRSSSRNLELAAKNVPPSSDQSSTTKSKRTEKVPTEKNIEVFMRTDSFKKFQVAQPFGRSVAAEPFARSGLPVSPDKARTNPNLAEQEAIQAPEEREYKYLLSQIRYYEQAADKIGYQKKKILESTDELLIRMNSPAISQEIAEYSQKTAQINAEIENQRNLESQITKFLNQLQNQYEDLMTSIDVMSFKRPTVITEESKALILQIENLKTESRQISESESEPKEERYQSEIQIEHDNFEDSSLNDLLRAIHQQNRLSSDPRYIANIKMACIRDEWGLFASSDIQINVSYKISPKIRIQVGNKGIKPMTGFTIMQNDVIVHKGVLQGKNYYMHEIIANNELIDCMLLSIKISYSLDNQPFKHSLYIPTGLLTFGEFIPVTEKELRSELALATFQTNGTYKPIDKTILNDIEECLLYMPNLLFLNRECWGLFRTYGRENGVISIIQRGQMLSVSGMGVKSCVLKLLEFVLTV